MYKVFAFLTRKEGLTAQEFREHYETRHVPLILSLAPAPLLYRRQYIKIENKVTQQVGEVDFDVVTELGFKDEGSFKSWMEKLFDPSNDNAVDKDEAQFLDPTKTRAYATDEFASSE